MDIRIRDIRAFADVVLATSRDQRVTYGPTSVASTAVLDQAVRSNDAFATAARSGDALGVGFGNDVGSDLCSGLGKAIANGLVDTKAHSTDKPAVKAPAKAGLAMPSSVTAVRVPGIRSRGEPD